jgi:hypothetical protein
MSDFNIINRYEPVPQINTNQDKHIFTLVYHITICQ